MHGKSFQDDLHSQLTPPPQLPFGNKRMYFYFVMQSFPITNFICLPSNFQLQLLQLMGSLHRLNHAVRGESDNNHMTH